MATRSPWLAIAKLELQLFDEKPEEPVEIIFIPEFRRGVTLAYLDQPADCAIAPLPEQRTEEQAWGDDFTDHRWHDKALSFSSSPITYVRALILDEPIPWRADEPF